MSYLLKQPGTVALLLLQHLQITITGILIALPLAVILALVIRRLPWLQTVVLGTLSIIYTVPSLALMILLVPVLGLSANTVIAAIALYAQVILVRQLTVGLAEIPAELQEAALGMGMNPWQRWWWVEVPLIWPVFLAGLRLATIVGIAIATLGAKFGAGGLGVLLFEGIAQAGRYDKIWAGAIAIAVLALGINRLLLSLESWRWR